MKIDEAEYKFMTSEEMMSKFEEEYKHTSLYGREQLEPESFETFEINQDIPSDLPKS